MVSIQKGKLNKLIKEELEKYINTILEQKLKNEEHLLIKTTEIEVENEKEDEEETPKTIPDNNIKYKPDPEILRKVMKMMNSSKEI